MLYKSRHIYYNQYDVLQTSIGDAEVVKSAFKIMRAALFCSLFILSIFVIDVDPHELEP